MTRFASLLVALVLLLFGRTAWAHKPSDAYVRLVAQGATVDARLDLALRDVDGVLDLDADGDGKLTWAEVSRRATDVGAYATSRLALRVGDAPCDLAPTARLEGITEHSDGVYAVLRAQATCPSAPSSERPLVVAYRLFFDVDALHRGLVHADLDGVTRSAIATATATEVRLAPPGTMQLAALRQMVREGVVHIWEGYDHLLFLLALLLPSVLRRDASGTWTAVDDVRTALVDVLRIVTAFTVAHSLTLALSVLGLVTLPSRLVESAIAASVVLAAANNLVPLLREQRWTGAFALGLLHGFGFSATLQDLELPREHLATTLFGFNLGVEVGQMAVVLAFVPLAYAARRTAGYRRVALGLGSVAIAAVALVWLVERAFVVRILS